MIHEDVKLEKLNLQPGIITMLPYRLRVMLIVQESILYRLTLLFCMLILLAYRIRILLDKVILLLEGVIQL